MPFTEEQMKQVFDTNIISLSDMDLRWRKATGTRSM